MWGKRLLLITWVFSLFTFAISFGEELGVDYVVVKSSNIEPYNKAITSFKVNCQGRSVDFNLKGKESEVNEVVQKIKGQKPKIIITIGKLATLLISKEISDIPVVFGVVLNPEEFLSSRDNVAGVSLNIPVSKQLKTLLAVIPSVKVVGTLYNPKKSRNLIKELYKTAKEDGVELIAVKIDEPEDAPQRLKAIKSDIDAFLLLPDPTVANKEVFFNLLKFVVKNKIPLWTPSKAFVQAGALVSLAHSYEGIGEQVCNIVKQIENGKPPSEIGVVPPQFLELTFNLKTAEQLNLSTIPLTATKYCKKEKCKISVY